MKTAALLAALILVAVPATADTWQQTLEAPESGAVITVDIGTEIVTLESVAVHVVGMCKNGGYSCDGPEETSFYPEFNILDGSFGQPGTTDDMSLSDEMVNDPIEGYDFDIVHEFDVSDPGAWDFLDDGPVDFTITQWLYVTDPSGGYCVHIFSSFDLYSLTLTVTYNETVGDDESTWGHVKTLFR